MSLTKKGYPTVKRSSSNEHASFFSLPQLPIVKVVDIFLRNPLAPLGQIPGDCNNPSVRLTLRILLSVLPNDALNKGILPGFDGRKNTSKITSHVILNEGASKEITEIWTQHRAF